MDSTELDHSHWWEEKQPAMCEKRQGHCDLKRLHHCLLLALQSSIFERRAAAVDSVDRRLEARSKPSARQAMAAGLAEQLLSTVRDQGTPTTRRKIKSAMLMDSLRL